MSLHHPTNITPLRSYRATLIPRHRSPSQALNHVENQGSTSGWPQVQLKAGCKHQARTAAHAVTALRVVHVEAVEGGAA